MLANVSSAIEVEDAGGKVNDKIENLDYLLKM